VENGCLWFRGLRVATGDEDALLVLCDMAQEGNMVPNDVLAIANKWGVRPLWRSAFAAMAGERLVSIAVGPEGYELHVVTDAGEYEFRAEGDCCAHAFIAEQPGVGEMRDANGDTVVKWVIADGERSEPEDYEVIDSTFYTLHTSGGMLQFTLRIEHNGYYGGALETVKDPHGIGRYGMS